MPMAICSFTWKITTFYLLLGARHCTHIYFVNTPIYTGTPVDQKLNQTIRTSMVVENQQVASNGPSSLIRDILRMHTQGFTLKRLRNSAGPP